MNTYDLANRLEEFYSGTHIQKAAETLKEQADQIKMLEEECAALRKQLNELLD